VSGQLKIDTGGGGEGSPESSGARGQLRIGGTVQTVGVKGKQNHDIR